jgi:hypothetical protein
MAVAHPCIHTRKDACCAGHWRARRNQQEARAHSPVARQRSRMPVHISPLRIITPSNANTGARGACSCWRMRKDTTRGRVALQRQRIWTYCVPLQRDRLAQTKPASSAASSRVLPCSCMTAAHSLPGQQASVSWCVRSPPPPSRLAVPLLSAASDSHADNAPRPQALQCRSRLQLLDCMHATHPHTLARALRAKPALK